VVSAGYELTSPSEDNDQATKGIHRSAAMSVMDIDTGKRGARQGKKRSKIKEQKCGVACGEGDSRWGKPPPYQHYFNLARKNSGKEYQTPRQLVRLKDPHTHPLLPLLEPVWLDNLHENILHSSPAGGYDVWALP
jgi:hypothetical protein